MCYWFFANVFGFECMDNPECFNGSAGGIVVKTD